MEAGAWTVMQRAYARYGGVIDERDVGGQPGVALYLPNGYEVMIVLEGPSWSDNVRLSVRGRHGGLTFPRHQDQQHGKLSASVNPRQVRRILAHWAGKE